MICPCTLLSWMKCSLADRMVLGGHHSSPERGYIAGTWIEPRSVGSNLIQSESGTLFFAAFLRVAQLTVI